MRYPRRKPDFFYRDKRGRIRPGHRRKVLKPEIEYTREMRVCPICGQEVSLVEGKETSLGRIEGSVQFPTSTGISAAVSGQISREDRYYCARCRRPFAKSQCPKKWIRVSHAQNQACT